MAASSHAQRWITVAFVVPVLIVFFLFSSAFSFTLFAVLVGALTLWEYFKNFCGAKNVLDAGFLLAAAANALIMVSAYKGAFSFLLLFLWLAVFAFGARAMITYDPERGDTALLAREILAVVYIPLMLCSVVLLRAADHGVKWLFFALFLAFISDTGAFYGGKFFGSHMLIPKLSPKKTVEGSIGGIVGDVVVVVAFRLLVFDDLSFAYLAGIAVCASLATQIGDLFESMLKRSFGVKDTGGILPGHGGLLDRIDGLLFSGPVIYCFMTLVPRG